MTAQDQTPVALLMGDLIGSEKAASPTTIHGIFNKSIARANALDKKLISPLTITLGDEFQGMPRTMADSCGMAQRLRLDLLSNGVDCRFVIGAATLHTALNRRKAWNMMGPGLSAARAILNDKQDFSVYRFSLPGEPAWQTALDSLGAALSDIERGWTGLQRQTVIDLQLGRSVEQIARSRNGSDRTVYKVRKAAKFDRYLQYWKAIGESLVTLDERYGLA